MSTGSFQVPLPGSSNIRVVGITNSGWWSQRITITPPGGAPIVWTGTGAQTNQVVGQTVLGPYSSAEGELTVTMEYDPGDGSGFHPSDVKADTINMAGLSGYVVGGQDGGGRGPLPAYWNTVAFIFWAESY